MSEALVFTQTGRFKEAVSLINSTSVERFSQFLSRVLRAASTTETSSVKNAFSSAELEKLPQALALPITISGTEAQVANALIDGCTFILETAAYHALSPNNLFEQLQKSGINEDKATIFAEVWKSGGATLLEHLRSAHMAPLSLNSVDWRLHLQLCHQLSSSKKQQLLQQQNQQQQQNQEITPIANAEVVNAPTTIFQFNLTDDTGSSSTNDEQKQKQKANRSFIVELTKAELTTFYNQLERIQDQLDNLS